MDPRLADKIRAEARKKVDSARVVSQRAGMSGGALELIPCRCERCFCFQPTPLSDDGGTLDDAEVDSDDLKFVPKDEKEVPFFGRGQEELLSLYRVGGSGGVSVDQGWNAGKIGRGTLHARWRWHC